MDDGTTLPAEVGLGCWVHGTRACCRTDRIAMNSRRSYQRLLTGWSNIVSRSLPDDAKTEACVALLRHYVDALADARVKQNNPTLRFYADMAALDGQLISSSFSGSNAHLRPIAIWPALRLVRDWLQSHALMGRAS
jgi:hypothetical protein